MVGRCRNPYAASAASTARRIIPGAAVGQNHSFAVDRLRLNADRTPGTAAPAGSGDGGSSVGANKAIDCQGLGEDGDSTATGAASSERRPKSLGIAASRAQCARLVD